MVRVKPQNSAMRPQVSIPRSRARPRSSSGRRAGRVATVARDTIARAHGLPGTDPRSGAGAPGGSPLDRRRIGGRKRTMSAIKKLTPNLVVDDLPGALRFWVD